jgi:hypothetical protein
MQFEKSITINIPANMIFQQYMDVSNWNKWDKDVFSSSIDGTFEMGSTGLLKPSSGPQGKFRLTEVTLNQSFTSQTALPLCALIFEHTLKPIGKGTLVTHKVQFTGVLSFLFGRLIGASIKKGLPNALMGLKSVCENQDMGMKT